MVPPIGSPEFYRNPYSTYRELLSSGTRAVRLSPHVVVFTHYQDCLDILRDPRLSARRYVRGLAHFTGEQRRELANWESLAQKMMFFMDTPDHPRVRKLLLKAFSPEAMAAMQPRIEALLREILDGLPVGETFDFMRRVAHRFPALVIGEILGMPHSAWDRLMEWSDTVLAFAAAMQAPFELAQEAIGSPWSSWNTWTACWRKSASIPPTT
jgi:cytochrome P450